MSDRHLGSLAPVATGSPDAVSCMPRLSWLTWDCDSGHGAGAMRGAEQLGELSMDTHQRVGASGAVGRVQSEAVDRAGVMQHYDSIMIWYAAEARSVRYGCAPVRRRAGHLRVHLDRRRATRQQWRPRPRASPLCRAAAACSDATTAGGDPNWVFGSTLTVRLPGGRADKHTGCDDV